MTMPMISLKEVANFINGKAFKPTDWSEEGVPIIRIQNLNGLDKPFNYWAGPLDKEVHVKLNDLLLAWSGTPGTSFGAHIWKGGEAVLNQHIFRVDLKEDLVTKEWAKFVINAQLSKLIGMAHGGVGLKHVTKGMVEGLEIPVPTLSEQRRIAAILDQADALRAKRREALVQLDSLTQSIFIEMFGDPTTNRKKFPTETIGELVKLKSGDFLPASGMAEGGKFPVLGGNGVNGYHDQFMFDESKIVIGRVGVYCGCVHISPPNSWVTDNALYVSQRSPKVSFDYLAFSLKLARLNQYASQSAQPLISGARLNPVEILIPPLDQQTEFTARANAVEALKATHNAALQELDRLFASLQHRAFLGEL